MDSTGRLLLRHSVNSSRTAAWARGIADFELKLTGQHSLGNREQIWSAITHALRFDEHSEKYFYSALGIEKVKWGEISESAKFNRGRWTTLPKKKSDAHSEFTFIDLFAGIGGFHLALHSQGGECVFASEWDRSARVTYAMNFGIVPFGDIRGFTRDESGTPLTNSAIRKRIPYADIVSAGFPCQPFSVAGLSSRNFHGLESGLNCEAQGTLFEDILLIAKSVRPKALILENVRNLTSHDGGNTIRVIRNEIDSAGYVILPAWNERKDWAVIDSRSVIGQARKRVYLVCVRKDLARALEAKKGAFQFPLFSVQDGRFNIGQAIDADTTLSNSEKFERYSISNRLFASHLDRDRRHAERNNGFQTRIMDDLSKPAPTLVARYYKDGKDCLIPSPTKTSPPRMLTPRECANLQTFPQHFWIPESKTAAYKQFGNSITVEIARRISSDLVKYLDL